MALALSGTGACLESNARAGGLEGRQELQRALSEYLFLSAQMGFSHREAIESTEEKFGTRNGDEFSVRISASAQELGPLGAYFGMGLRLRPASSGMSPFVDPYDDFDLRRNLRLNGAYLEYNHKDLDHRERFRIRAGRLAQLDHGAQLLICDGVSGRFLLKQSLQVSAYGGIRARLDDLHRFSERPRRQQLCSGAGIDWVRAAWKISARYLYEQLHRPQVRASYFEAMLGINIAAELLVADSPSRSAGPLSLLVRFDGDWASTDERLNLRWLFVGQSGDDPRSYGRADFAVLSQAGANQAAFERLYLGNSKAHVRGHFDLQYWLLPQVALRAGAFGRAPLRNDDRQSLRPQVMQAWLGPELSTASGWRLGLEGEVGRENAGTDSDIFALGGEAVSRQTGLRVYGELPWTLSEEMRIALSPSFLASWSDLENALTRSENQARYAFGGVLAWTWDRHLRLAAHYDAEILPQFGSGGIHLVHRAELWLQGSYR